MLFSRLLCGSGGSSVLTPSSCFPFSAVRVINDNGLRWTCKSIKIIIALALGMCSLNMFT